MNLRLKKITKGYTYNSLERGGNTWGLLFLDGDILLWNLRGFLFFGILLLELEDYVFSVLGFYCGFFFLGIMDPWIYSTE